MAIDELYNVYESQDSVLKINENHMDTHYDTPHIQEYMDEP